MTVNKHPKDGLVVDSKSIIVCRIYLVGRTRPRCKRVDG